MELKGLSAEDWTWTGIICAYSFRDLFFVCISHPGQFLSQQTITVSAIYFGGCVLIGIVRTSGFRDCLLNRTVQAMDCGDCLSVGISQTIDFDDCLLIGIVQAMDFGDHLLIGIV